MKNLISFVLMTQLVSFGDTKAQVTYFASNPTGIKVYKYPTRNSEVLSILPYGYEFWNLEKMEKYKILGDKSNWSRVEYENWYYIKASESEDYRKIGYILNSELIPSNNINQTNQPQEISEDEFRTLQPRTNLADRKQQFITNIDSINKLIDHSVVWNHNLEYDFFTLVNVTIENGLKIEFDTINADYGFISGSSGYYPDFGILKMKGGHESDVCFSIKTGEFHNTCGNPEFVILSPNDQFRLAGYFGGQECISYFFQQRVNDRITYFDCPQWLQEGCLFEEFYWLNDTEFIYSTHNYMNAENETLEYFTGHLTTQK